MITSSAIQPDWHFAVWAVLIAVAVLGLYLEGTVVGRKFSGVIAAMFIAAVLSNLGVMPQAAPAYGVIWDYFVPIAIPLFLMHASIKDILKETGPMIAAFALAVVGTVVGVLTAFYFVPLGAWSAELVGVFTASFIGGGVNFAAVSTALNIDKEFLAVVAAADNLVGAGYLALLAYLPSIVLLRRWIPSEVIEGPDKVKDLQDGPVPSRVNGTVQIGSALALSLGICGIGIGMASALNVPEYQILFVTILSLVAANVGRRWLLQLDGPFEVGLIIMYVFLVSIGAQANVGAVLESGVYLVWFTIILVSVQLIVVLLAGKLLKIDLAELIIATNACAAGPTTAVALAAARRWDSLVTPGLMCGILGYAIANFIAMAMFELVR